ncbi:hypothetical protein MJN12_13205 [Salmonella enterica subsp. enterica serovar Montevideo]|nr:hypothetical protein [Salmonella enterica subsp. enterica serovar Cerro]EFV6898405.1 hypothetical protein [Salmonella enterica subsp. enterica serovar Eko]EGF1542856.1 hypothetical protein [Salmonella enterica subsp. enterica serovar Chester]EHL6138421.1 hypothetical protein [Salmonella enterica subsp. enterica serovar Montevideo]EIN6506750.1 hypothetical protein [Salmonella enterica subsp. enterica serovar Typhimurium]EJH6868489.1 hypothetical protein [Salmonella enterica subsp. enterica s
MAAFSANLGVCDSLFFAGIPTTAPARPEAKLLAFPALDAPVRSQNCWQIAAVT